MRFGTDCGCDWPVCEPDCCPRWDEATEEDRQCAMWAAVEFLWAASGRQFGLCEITVRPCGLSCPCTGGACHDQHGIGWQPRLVGGKVTNCRTPCDLCRCCAPCEVALPGNVETITSVRVDGQLVPPHAYRVDNYKYLVREDGECFPECQDFSQPADHDCDCSPADSPGSPGDGVGCTHGTWAVTYMEGVPVPHLGQTAAGELACALLKSCPDGQNCGDCAAREAIDTPIVNTWLEQVNPHKQSRPAQLIVPGMQGFEHSHRMQTWP